MILVLIVGLEVGVPDESTTEIRPAVRLPMLMEVTFLILDMVCEMTVARILGETLTLLTPTLRGTSFFRRPGRQMWEMNPLLWALIPTILFLPRHTGIRTIVLALTAVGPAEFRMALFPKFGLARITAALTNTGGAMFTSLLLVKSSR